MIRSTDRILTTHTGSLPRPDDLIRMMFAKEEGIPVDKEALGECITSTVSKNRSGTESSTQKNWLRLREFKRIDFLGPGILYLGLTNYPS